MRFRLIDQNTPIAAWCECRPVVRAATEAAERWGARKRGEAAVDEDRAGEGCEDGALTGLAWGTLLIRGGAR